MAIQHALSLQPWPLPTHAVSRRRLQTQVDAMVIWKSCLYDIVPIFFLYLQLTLFQQGPQDISAEREPVEKAHMSRQEVEDDVQLKNEAEKDIRFLPTW